MIAFIVPGIPVAKGRARAFVRNGHIAHCTPERTSRYENLVRLSAHKEMKGRPLFSGACQIEIGLYMPVPSSWSNKKRTAALSGEIRPTAKPDCDNVLKCINDALNGVVWVDDKQVVDVRVEKRYSTTPQAIVIVQEI